MQPQKSNEINPKANLPDTGSKGDCTTAQQIPLISRILERFSKHLPVRHLSHVNAQGVEVASLHRYSILSHKRFGIYLQNHIEAGHSTELRDQPWHSATIQLSGGYSVRQLTAGLGSSKRPVRRFSRVSADTFYAVEDVKAHTWELVIRSRRFKSWGFISKVSNNQASYRQVSDSPVSSYRPAVGKNVI